MPAVADWIGKELAAGRYKVQAAIGSGGMACIYRADDRHLDCDVVIKVPQMALLQQDSIRLRFACEVRSLVELVHPHIVPILDCGDEDGIPFAVMEFLGGGNLRDRYEEYRESWPIEKIYVDLDKWLPTIAKTLDFIHERGYVHRDIKPGNILFNRTGIPYLADFGVSKAVAEGGISVEELTRTGMFVGTLGYIAPEVIQEKECDGRADQYALAAVVYEALAKKRPFSGTSSMQQMLAHTTQERPLLHEQVEGIPAVIGEGIARGMSIDPAMRFGNCTEFVEAILRKDGLQVAEGNSAAPATQELQAPDTSVAARQSDEDTKKDHGKSDKVRFQCSCGKWSSFSRNDKFREKAAKCSKCNEFIFITKTFEVLLENDPGLSEFGRATIEVGKYHQLKKLVAAGKCSPEELCVQRDILLKDYRENISKSLLDELKFQKTESLAKGIEKSFDNLKETRDTSRSWTAGLVFIGFCVVVLGALFIIDPLNYNTPKALNRDPGREVLEVLNAKKEKQENQLENERRSMLIYHYVQAISKAESEDDFLTIRFELGREICGLNDEKSDGLELSRNEVATWLNRPLTDDEATRIDLLLSKVGGRKGMQSISDQDILGNLRVMRRFTQYSMDMQFHITHYAFIPGQVRWS